MARKKAGQSPRTDTPKEVRTLYLEAIDNKKLRMPADIEKAVRARQVQAHEGARRDSALEQIARKLGIHDEMVEGDGTIAFRGPGPGLVFDVPQWAISATDA